MQVGIIITNPTSGNPKGRHSAEKLAAACAERLIAVDTTMMNDDRQLEARKLEIGIIEALTPHHVAAQSRTKAELHANSANHFARSDLHEVGGALNQAVAAVQNAAKGSLWEANFKTPEAVAHMKQTIGQFLVDTMHLERFYHADDHPDDKHAAAYRVAPTGIAVIPVTE